MSYSLRNKKKLHHGDPAGDAGNEPTKEKRKADKPFVPPPDQSNSSTEDKTNVTKQSELKTMITKTSIAMELGNINHNLDVLHQNIQENAEKFNENTIFMFDIGKTMVSAITEIEYRIICKIGYGGFSVVWLVVDMKNKEFKVAKVFKYDYGILKLEREILQQTSKHPNILRFYERLDFSSDGKEACAAIYEPLGKDLNMLMKEASKHGGLTVPVIKKVAKHILSALKAIHDLKVIHSDIKLHNIATCVSQLSLRREFEKIVEFMKSGQNISSLRMVCQKDAEIDMNEKTEYFEEDLEEVSKLEIKEVTELIFKLIDFGNAMEEGTESSTGTRGFRPPEYFFRSPLLPSHDIWSLGVTIVVLFTNKSFLEYGNGSKIEDKDIGTPNSTCIAATSCETAIKTPNRNDINEITALRNMFGKLSRRHFKGFKDPDGYKKKFSTRYYSSRKSTKRITKFLRTKFDKLQIDDNERNGLIGFLLEMLKTVPNERKSAAELLLNPWLNDTSECDFNGQIDLTQTSSDSLKTQERNSKDTCETPLDDLSSDEQIKHNNAVISLTSNDPKHSKNDGETKEKTREAPKRDRRFNSFIFKEDDDKFNLYHKYWRIPYRGKNGFQCPKCLRYINFDCKIGFVMVTGKPWHNKNCDVRNKFAPRKGQIIYKPANQKGYKETYEVITKEAVERKRELLEKQGFKSLFDPVLPDEICPKESEIEDNYYETDSYETDDTVDSDSDDTEEDSNETIGEFGSDESYIEDDASYAPHMENFSDENFAFCYND